MISIGGVSLPNPQLDDVIRIEPKVMVKRDYLSKLHSVRLGPAVKYFDLVFKDIPATYGVAIKEYFEQWDGNSFTYIDYNNVSTTVVFAENTLEMSYTGRDDLTGGTGNTSDYASELCNFNIKLRVA